MKRLTAVALVAFAVPSVMLALVTASDGDVPARRATIFHLVIDLKTIKAFHIEIPRSLLLEADQVIERDGRVIE